MNDKCVVLNAKKMNFDGKLDFSVLSSDVTVYDDIESEFCNAGTDEDVGMWKPSALIINTSRGTPVDHNSNHTKNANARMFL